MKDNASDLKHRIDKTKNHLNPAINWLLEAAEKRQNRVLCNANEHRRAYEENRQPHLREGPLMGDADTLLDNISQSLNWL